jgi:hypothetical protein
MPEHVISPPTQTCIEQYRLRAQEMRDKAMQTHDAESRHEYIWLAKMYEFLATAVSRQQPVITT